MTRPDSGRWKFFYISQEDPTSGQGQTDPDRTKIFLSGYRVFRSIGNRFTLSTSGMEEERIIFRWLNNKEDFSYGQRKHYLTSGPEESDTVCEKIRNPNVSVSERFRIQDLLFVYYLLLYELLYILIMLFLFISSYSLCLTILCPELKSTLPALFEATHLQTRFYVHSVSGPISRSLFVLHSSLSVFRLHDPRLTLSPLINLSINLSVRFRSITVRNVQYPK